MLLLLLLFFSDALSSVVALGGVCGTIIGLPLLDPLAGCGKQTPFVEACFYNILKSDHFTKTGSGQAHRENAEKKRSMRFVQARGRRPGRANR